MQHLLSLSRRHENDESHEFVTVEVDGWLQLKLHADHHQQVMNARNVLTTALVDFVRDPNKPLSAVVARGVDKIAEALSVEQRRLIE